MTSGLLISQGGLFEIILLLLIPPLYREPDSATKPESFLISTEVTHLPAGTVNMVLGCILWYIS
jgi:hypothetical protein